MAPHLRQFNERIGARTLLIPLDATETVEYIDYRLRARNGSAVKIFNRKALKYIVAQSAGIPRRVNVLCHNSMLLAYGAGAKQVSLKMAREAVADYQDLFASATKASSAENPRPRTRRWLRWNFGLTAIVAALTGMIIALIMFGSSAARRNQATSISAMDGSAEAREPIVLPRSVVVSPSSSDLRSGSSTTPIAVPDYGTAAASEPAASASASVMSEKVPNKHAVMRLAKQRERDEEE
jgi:hypothetical protein